MSPVADGSILGVVFDVGRVLLQPLPDLFARVAEFGLTRSETLAFITGPDAVEMRFAGREFRIADMAATVESELSSRLGDQARQAAQIILSVYADPNSATWDESMIELLDDLHQAKYRTGLLANAPADFGETHFPHLADSLDATVLSGRDGVGKPMAKSYELIADRLGLRLDQCFFIDDLAENVEAAKRLGMSGHQFTGDISLLTEALRAAGVSW